MWCPRYHCFCCAVAGVAFGIIAGAQPEYGNVLAHTCYLTSLPYLACRSRPILAMPLRKPYSGIALLMPRMLVAPAPLRSTIYPSKVWVYIQACISCQVALRMVSCVPNRRAIVPCRPPTNLIVERLRLQPEHHLQSVYSFQGSHNRAVPFLTSLLSAVALFRSSLYPFDNTILQHPPH